MCKARRSYQGGMTYLMVLWIIALGSVAMMAATQSWVMDMRRQKEVELLFRGEQIKAALLAYRQSSPPQAPQFPVSLDELLEDRRGPLIKRHLRRLYRDPMTVDGEWGLIKQGPWIVGVHSQSSARPLRAAIASNDGATSYEDWRFEVLGATAGASFPPSVRP